jgi:hypothetical protein
MTEANVPSSGSEASQHPSQQQSTRPDAARLPVTSLPTAQIEDWQTVDFPNAISIDAIERQAMYDPADLNPRVTELTKRDRPKPETIKPDLTPASMSEPSSQSDRPNEPAPSVSDLIALIQELNQCNHALLNRVNQLEIELDAAQSQLQPTDAAPSGSDSPSLAHQLEFALQANQRQQILLDTLTEQLESSQERIAELEQDCARTQQNYQEQAQRLADNDVLCRDLRSRLQRQQRYTLQYKVALEKSLDVPPPSYLLGAEVDAEQPRPSEAPPDSTISQPRQIQPWSGQATPPVSKLDARLRSALLGDRTELPLPEGTVPATPESNAQPSQQPVQPSQSVPDDVSTAQSAPLPAIGQTILPPKLAAFSSAQPTSKSDSHAPLHLPQPSLDQPAEPGSKTQQETAELTSDLTSDLDPTLLKQLDAAVQPLIDSVMDAIKHDRTPAPPTPETEPTESAAAAPPEPASNHPSDAQSPPDKTVSPEAEESLWQDLARLVNVSTDDVVQASLAGDFDAFAAIDYDAIAKAKRQQHPSPEAIAPMPDPSDLPADESASDHMESSDRPVSPEPKRKSLASIDLPKFV